jgi:DNA-binding LytR/AlgR family response regulator
MLTALLIEDEPAWQMKLQVMLDELGISVLGTTATVVDSIKFLKKKKPDLILADILLDNEIVFSVFDFDISFLRIPTIFITSSTNDLHYKQSQKLTKSSFIVKPVHKLTLKSLIDSLLNTKPKQEPFIEVKGSRNEKIKLPLYQIIYLEQEGNNCLIKTHIKQFVLKKPLHKMMGYLDENFLQVHSAFCINTKCIENYTPLLDKVKLQGGIVVPIGRTKREKIKEYLSQQLVKKNDDFASPL